FQSAVAVDERYIRRVAQPVRDALIGLPDDLVLARLDARHVDGDAAVDHDAEIAAAAREMCGACARDQRLRRDAAGIDAGATDTLPLEDRRFATRPGKADGERRPGLSGADHDCIETLGGHGFLPGWRCRQLSVRVRK